MAAHKCYKDTAYHPHHQGRMGSGFMSIRLATLDDVAAVSALYGEFFAFHAELQPGYSRATKETGSYPAHIITSENEDLIVAEADAAIVGFLHILEDTTPPYDSVVPHRFAECVDLFVAPEHRKRGIAAALLNTAKNWAKSRRLDYIELKVVAGNKNAIHFYSRQGFHTAMHTMRTPL